MQTQERFQHATAKMKPILLCSLDEAVRRLAVDASAGKLYFTTKSVVEVINLDGSDRKTLITHAKGVMTYEVAVRVSER